MNCPTPLGRNYANAVSWLKGATLTDFYTANGVGGRIYMAKLLKNGKFAAILWSTGQDETVRLPKEKDWFAGTTWDKLKYAVKLDSSTRTEIPTEFLENTVIMYKTARVGKMPVLLTQE